MGNTVIDYDRILTTLSVKMTDKEKYNFWVRPTNPKHHYLTTLETQSICLYLTHCTFYFACETGVALLVLPVSGHHTRLVILNCFSTVFYREIS